MAIAAIVAHTYQENLQDLTKALQAMPEILEMQPVEADKLAATVEVSSDKLLKTLEAIEHLPVLNNLELVYVNYEDDLEANGQIVCPPLADIHRNMQ